MLNEKFLISVCTNDNHVRTWRITRFRSRISTQPGTIPVSSFKIWSSQEIGSIGIDLCKSSFFRILLLYHHNEEKNI